MPTLSPPQGSSGAYQRGFKTLKNFLGLVSSGLKSGGKSTTHLSLSLAPSGPADLGQVTPSVSWHVVYPYYRGFWKVLPMAPTLVWEGKTTPFPSPGPFIPAPWPTL